MPQVDPLTNPVGFWALFAVAAMLVILLAAGAIYFVVSVGRSAGKRQASEQADADTKFDAVAAEQRRLDEQLKAMRKGNAPPPPPGP